MLKILLVIISLSISVFTLATEPKWQQTLPSDYSWSQITETGSLLVSTQKSLLNINPADGSVIWQRDDMGELSPFNVSAIAGTPLMLINKHAGTLPPKTQLQVINSQTGKSLWDSGIFQATNLIAIPIPSHNLVLYAADHTGGTPWGQSRTDLKPGTYISGIKMDTGEIVFDTRLDSLRKAVRHPSDNSGGWIPDMDLNGHPAPVVEGDFIYLPFTGLVALNLRSGKIQWETTFKTAHNGLKLTTARPIIEGDVIYTSGAGHIYAINKTTGNILWDEKVGRNYLIPELLIVGDQVVGRIGGSFSNGKKISQQKPFGVVALNRQDGRKRWLWKKGKKGMTNLAYLEKRNWIVVADRNKLYALNLSAKKKPKIDETMELEFKRSMGSVEMAAKGATVGSGLLSGGLLGGIQGGLKAFDTSAQEDPPTNISQLGEDLVVRAQYHLLSFRGETMEIEYSIEFKPPGVNGLALAAMGAVTALNTLGNAGMHSSWGTRNMALDNALSVSGAFEGAVAQRYAASEQAENLAFFLTTAKESGLQLLGINLDSGEEVGAVPMTEKEPEFMIDNVMNVVYYVKEGKQLMAYPF